VSAWMSSVYTAHWHMKGCRNGVESSELLVQRWMHIKWSFCCFILIVLHWKIYFCVYSVFAGERTPPPASKQAVKDLPTVKTTTAQEGYILMLFIPNSVL